VLAATDGLYQVPVWKVEQMRKRYPLLDTDYEFQELSNWCEDNVRKRKTLAGMGQFIGNWFRGSEADRKQGRRRRPRARQPSMPLRGGGGTLADRMAAQLLGEDRQ